VPTQRDLTDAAEAASIAGHYELADEFYKKAGILVCPVCRRDVPRGGVSKAGREIHVCYGCLTDTNAWWRRWTPPKE
jgi:hypothetical protein